MTSSLPDFSSCPVNPRSADAASLAALGTTPGSDTSTPTGATGGFAALMGTNAGPTVAATGPASEPPAEVFSRANRPAWMLTPPLPPPAAVGACLPVEPDESGRVLMVAAVMPGLETAAPASPVAPAPAPSSGREITRDMLEAAASFVASLLQAALPEIQLPQLAALPGNVLSGAGTAGESPSPLLPAQDGTPGGVGTAGTPAPDGRAVAPAFTLATDGAIELKLDLAQLLPSGVKLDLPSDPAMTITAELKRPGEMVVRLEAAAPVVAPDAPIPAGVAGRAKFAVKYSSPETVGDSAGQPGERNFVLTGDKQFKMQSPLAGISVAQTETTMPVAPIEDPRFTRKPETFPGLTQRAEFQVVVPPAERINVPADAPAGQNFAERAVDTVTSLVDTQFSASLQKSGSVQLHLRFGGQDLSVHVELRDGAVHTNFRTDSPELQSALTREWQAVAGQSPEQMRRYLDPVFSPASSDPAPAFGRPQQQPQQDLPSRTPREPWAEPAGSFSRRSQLSDSFSPEPAALRGPSFLPTSLRLSVLA